MGVWEGWERGCILFGMHFSQSKNARLLNWFVLLLTRARIPTLMGSYLSCSSWNPSSCCRRLRLRWRLRCWSLSRAIRFRICCRVFRNLKFVLQQRLLSINDLRVVTLFCFTWLPLDALRLVQTSLRMLQNHSGLQQCRDRKFPISLQKCNWLSQVTEDLQHSVRQPLGRNRCTLPTWPLIITFKS